MHKKPEKLLIATGNMGKVREIAEMLAPLPLAIRPLADFDGVPEIAETGETFLENAVLKAVGYAKAFSSLTLADDSGLEVFALGGAPGVLSARFGGEKSSYAEKMRILLDMLANQESADRSARFVCSAVLADANGEVLTTSEGVCDGTIARQPAGTHGFGYDPIFIPKGYDKTFAELPDEVKQATSHRAKALNGIISYLLDFIVV